jgi:F-type H+-transporting ATPase subunit gamma
MPSQKEIRARISSTIGTQQITKAMKLVSATKLRKASEAIVKMRPYALKLQGIMSNLQDSAEDERLAVYFQKREVKSVLMVVVTSDRGLCGAFNANVVKRAKNLLENNYKDLVNKDKVRILCIGKKGAEGLKRLGFNCDTSYVSSLIDLSANSAFDFSQYVIDQYTSGTYDTVEIVYNQFKNAATQILTNEVLLPISKVNSSKDAVNSDYIFEPGKVEILQDLIPRSLKTHIYRAFLDSLASEHGARMISMDKATDNAGELLRSLKLAYNQARQAAITREISEIVGGVAALEGS